MSLFRSLLREAGKMANYNFREHARRRVIGGFREFQNANEQVAQEQYSFGASQLELLKRQSIISRLYPEMEAVAQQRSKKH
jgi:hypothetical protein